jgi:hypothetical protein
MMRRHLTYANVAATLALVFAMSGGALAAKHYMVESTSQINPKVLKKLRGHNGKKGTIGKTGLTGAAGAPGAPGATGPAGAPATKLLAAINEEGGVTRAQGLVSAQKTDTGEYKLTWNQPIDQCYPIATMYNFEDIIEVGGISKENPTVLTVETFTVRPEGGKVDPEDDGFYVAVLC